MTFKSPGPPALPGKAGGPGAAKAPEETVARGRIYRRKVAFPPQRLLDRRKLTQLLGCVGLLSHDLDEPHRGRPECCLRLCDLPLDLGKRPVKRVPEPPCEAGRD